MDCTCLKPVFDDMTLLCFMGVEIKDRNEEVGRPVFAWRTAPSRNTDGYFRRILTFMLLTSLGSYKSRMGIR
jgi:hypothetical protein